MAAKLSVKLVEPIKAAVIREVALVGIVEVDGVGAIRNLVAFRNNDYSILMGQTTSDSDGNFSITIRGGSLDIASIICIGANASENSTIFTHISLA